MLVAEYGWVCRMPEWPGGSPSDTAHHWTGEFVESIK